MKFGGALLIAAVLGAGAGCSTTENMAEVPAGASHSRSSRPRPAVCISAATTARLRSDRRRRGARSSLSIAGSRSETSWIFGTA